MNEKFLSASYKGKDLLEASGKHFKAPLQFKALMEELSEIEDQPDFIKTKIYEFALFIYGDEYRSNFFTDKIIEELN